MYFFKNSALSFHIWVQFRIRNHANTVHWYTVNAYRFWCQPTSRRNVKLIIYTHTHTVFAPFVCWAQRQNQINFKINFYTYSKKKKKLNSTTDWTSTLTTEIRVSFIFLYEKKEEDSNWFCYFDLERKCVY